jgi:hypothetical protein
MHTQAQAQREALRHQTSKKLLQAGRSSDSPAATEQGTEELRPEDYADIAALAGRLSAQQEEIQQLSSQLSSANAKRAELAKVRVFVCNSRPWSLPLLLLLLLILLCSGRFSRHVACSRLIEFTPLS